jgi:UDP-GlcNAc3NAcA epimerase
MHFVSIVGARPQFLKAAVVARAISTHPEIDHLVIHTGQHYDEHLSACFFADLQLGHRVVNLNIGSGRHGAQTGRMIEAIEEVLIKEPADWIIIYGDTNSTLAGALAAVKLRRRIAHVEAGLRSFCKGMAEEVNRVVADHLSDILFAPTRTAVANLQREGLQDASVHFVGDVMYDATELYRLRVNESKILAALGLRSKEFALATVHRAENADDPGRLRVIVKALRQVATDLPVVFPLHPRTRAALTSSKGLMACLADCSTVVVIEPVGYFDMSALERSARVILTDSGGVQKEAFFQGTPCVILREATEWPELVQAGASRLCPPLSADGIIQAVRSLGKGVPTGSFFGNGDAGVRIVQTLLET